jgi:hypothetical protein
MNRIKFISDVPGPVVGAGLPGFLAGRGRLGFVLPKYSVQL